MGFSLISRVRLCLNPLKPFSHQASSAFFTFKNSLCKSSHLPSTARSLCTRDSNPKSSKRQTFRTNNNRQTHAPGGEKYKAIRQRQGETWVDAAKGGGEVRQRPFQPKSVFTAGTAKRTAEKMKWKAALASGEEEGFVERREDRRTTSMIPLPDRPLSAAEWREFRESLGNPPRFEVKMICKMHNSGTDLDIAKSLLTFVASETGTLSYQLLLWYLTLCVSAGHDDETRDIYDIMKGSFPSLDPGASSLFIKSFSRTARWREAINLLSEVKKVFVPTSRNYSDIVAGAMSRGDMNTAWAHYDELLERGLNPHQDTWDALFKGGSTAKQVVEAGAMSQSEHQERLLRILLYMRNNQIYPQQGLTSTIKTWFESLPGQKWTGNWTRATPKGLCGCCGEKLESIQLTAEEYQQLKHRVMANVIEGQDVFNKTTPQELQQFREFVKSKPPFDVVIDGLNVANTSKDRGKQANMLLALVSELESRGLIILVLGRKHMLNNSSWKHRNMKLIQKRAYCFFTENISEDDPFLLYATLNSGNHCRFVSRDLMRDHKACLPDEATRRLFFKWQRGHQLVVHSCDMTSGEIRFRSVLGYDTIVQTSGDSWHVPYDDTDDRSSHEVPQKWLCLKQTH